MAESRIADVIVPEVFTDYTLLPSIYRSRFVRSGIVVPDARLDALLNGGGETFNMPQWNSTSGSDGTIPSETVPSAVSPITGVKQVVRRQFRELAWGSNNLASVLAGSNPVDAASAMVNDAWAALYDHAALCILEGVISDNVISNGGDLVVDISGAVGALANFNDEAVIDAQAKLGENGTVGMGDNAEGDFVAIVVHPDVYAFMRKLDLITYVPISEQARPLPFYMGMSVIVDRNAPKQGTDYTSIICKAGAMAIGVGSAGYVPTEIERVVNLGFGIDQLWTRRAFAIHSWGNVWSDTSVAGTSPTPTELIDPVNHARAILAEQMRVCAVISQINVTA